MLQKKTLDYKRYPGMWSLFGGTAESDDLKKEMERELQEEIGISIPIKFEFNSDYEENDKIIKKAHIFSAKIDDISKLSIGEGAGIVFFGKEELKNIKIIPACNNLLKLFFNKSKESK